MPARSGASRATRAARASTRAAFVAKRGSRASSGRSAASQNRANCASLPTARTRWPSAVANAWYGTIEGCALPSRRGGSPVTRKLSRLVRERGDLHVEQREIDVLPLAGPVPVGERGEDRGRRVHAGEEIRHRHADLHRAPAGGAVRLARDAHEPAHRLHEEVVAGPVAVRAVLAEAADRAVHEPRVLPREGGVREAMPREGADLVVLEEDVRPGCEPADDGLPLGPGDVDRHGPLAPVRRREICRRARAGAARGLEPWGSPSSRLVADPRPLDLDHLRSEVGEHLARPWAGEDAREVEDPDVGEGFASHREIILR